MRKGFFLLLLFVYSIHGSAQLNGLHYGLEAQGIYTSNDQVPFWMRALQHGSIPLSGASLSLIGRVQKAYDSTKGKLVDWGFGAEGRVNLGKEAQFILPEAYAKLHAGVFELKAGRVKEVTGLMDTALSSGSFGISGNALGIPKVEVGIPEFKNIFGGTLLAFKGNYTHGWLGEMPIQYTYAAPNNFPHVASATLYYHQTQLYGRLGKPEWRVKFYGGFNHEVSWGHERKIYGPEWTLSPLKTYWYVVRGGSFKNGSILNSRVGDHVGSLDIGLEYEAKTVRLFAYRQSFYESGALAHLANVGDGLNGISITNKIAGTKKTTWKKWLVEVLYTKNQAGELSSPADLPSGTEDYYNHTVYMEGWSYRGLALGTPFITSRVYARSGFPSDPTQYFINNRVLLFHTGFDLSVAGCDVVTKLSYSKNYGTFVTAPQGRRALGGRRDTPIYGIFGEADQFSGYLEATKSLQHHFNIGAALAVDAGKLLYPSTGVLVKLAWSLR